MVYKFWGAFWEPHSVVISGGAQEKHMGYQGVNLGQQHAWQIPYLLCNDLAPVYEFLYVLLNLFC